MEKQSKKDIKKAQCSYCKAKMYATDAFLFGFDDSYTVRNIVMEHIPVRCPVFIHKTTLSLTISVRDELVKGLIVYN